MASSSVQVWNTKHILQNNLKSKHILLMKLGQFKNFSKKFYEKILFDLETSSRLFLIFEEPQ